MLLWMILRECILLLVLGLALGVPVALSSTRILKSLLYELSHLVGVLVQESWLVTAAKASTHP
jgi:hypothetical protein